MTFTATCWQKAIVDNKTCVIYLNLKFPLTDSVDLLQHSGVCLCQCNVVLQPLGGVWLGQVRLQMALRLVAGAVDWGSVLSLIT